ncbi:MAG: hypothetical protein ACTSPY_05460 [Candidatus Helarchaeota archaeon]
MNKNLKFLTISILFGIFIYLCIYIFISDDLIVFLNIDLLTSEGYYVWVIYNIVIFLILQCPAILIYYKYKLKILLLTKLNPAYNIGDIIELEFQVSDKDNFIFIDIELEIQWPGKILGTENIEESFIIRLDTNGLIGINNFRVIALKDGYFSTSWNKELIII